MCHTLAKGSVWVGIALYKLTFESITIAEIFGIVCVNLVYCCCFFVWGGAVMSQWMIIINTIKCRNW